MRDECCHCQPFWDDELNQGIELVTIPHISNRNVYSASAAEYHVFNYSDYQTGNGNNEIEEEIYASVKVSNPRTDCSSPIIEHISYIQGP